MTTAINGVDYGSLGLGAAAPKQKDALGQEAFLQLMVKQLENQDPFKPMENGDFLGQLAQFGTVQGLGGLQNSFNELASSLVSNQALQAAGLVGRTALVESSRAGLEEGGSITGAVELPTSASLVRVQIVDSTGQVVRTLDLGDRPAGATRFTWDGTADGGGDAPPGTYSIVAQYSAGEGATAADVLVEAPVDSVLFGDGGFNLQLRGIGKLPFSAVRELRME
jgi:flagellar basal-body rod modification protein FlgD